MRFVYAVINLLILAGLIYLVGRKTIVKIFRSRREKITRELDEAETPFAPEPLPEMPAPYALYREYRYGKIKLTVYHRGGNEDTE